jgi:tetratricopeptide (TPR) repeat protein
MGRNLVAALACLSWMALASGCNDPGQTELARGNVFASRHQFDEAIQAYRQAAQAQPKRARPRELLGHVLFDLGRFDEAAQAYRDAQTVDPEGALEARIGLARVAAEKGDLPSALATLGEVLHRHPDNLYALLSRANLAVRRGQTQDATLALADTAEAMKIDPKNASVLYTRGCAFIAAKELDQADEAFARLGAAHPQSPLAAYGRARIASAKGLGHKDDVLKYLAESRSKAGQLAEGWKADEVESDPAFRAFKGDAEFERTIRGAAGS